MKQLLFISTMNGAPWGGSEVFWYTMALWMKQQGHDVSCCFYDWPHGKTEKMETLAASGCKLHLLPNPKTARNYVYKLLRKTAVKKKLYRLLQQDFDFVCISQGGLLDVTYLPYKRILPYLRKFILVYHNYNEFQALSLTRKRSFYKWASAASQNLVAAEKMLPVIKKSAGFTLPNPHVLINPVTIPARAQPFAWPSLNETGNYQWVCMGQLEIERKAQDILIKTLAAEKWQLRNWQLSIFGEGPDKQFLSDLITEKLLSHKIFLKGHTSNVEAALSGAHLLLHVSHLDAMPLVILEAMNMARPCVVSDVGDMPLWIQDGKQGYVVPVVTESMIDQVLERAWNERDKWQQMGMEAFSIFRQKYPQPYESHYENYFNSIMTQ